MMDLDELFSHEETAVDVYYTAMADASASIVNYLRKEGIEKSEFGKMFGKSPALVTKWISGQYNFSLKTLTIIQHKTGIPLIKKLHEYQIDAFADKRVFDEITEGAEFDYAKTQKEYVDQLSKLKEELTQKEIELIKLKRDTSRLEFKLKRAQAKPKRIEVKSGNTKKVLGRFENDSYRVKFVIDNMEATASHKAGLYFKDKTQIHKEKWGQLVKKS